MPAIGAPDPANLEAQALAELGISRRLEQLRRILPYPGIGGGGGYAVWYCLQQIQRFNAREAIDVSLAYIYRWTDCLELFRQTGNRARAKIVGFDLLNLILSGHFANTLGTLCRHFANTSETLWLNFL